VVLHGIIEWIYFYLIIFSQKEMGSKKHTADKVLHNMIEHIYVYSIIFTQKEMGSKKHTADVVLPGGRVTLVGPVMSSSISILVLCCSCVSSIAANRNVNEFICNSL
jgi:hypothetical protein